MQPRVAVVLVALASGCAHSYTAVSYDVSRRATGTTTAMQGNDDRHSGTLAIGFGTRRAAMEVVVHGHDLEVAVDPWLAASFGLELKLAPVRRGPVSAFLHGGPVRAAIVDSETGDLTWGAGLSYGLGVMVGAGGVQLFVDVRSEQLFYTGAPMTATGGSAAVRTVSLGLQFGG
jgi:hypothetical protein